MNSKQLLQTNKDFILGCVFYGNTPDKSNEVLHTVINAYSDLTKKTFDLSTCLTCGENNALQEIYLYCKDNNWFENKSKK